MKTITVVTKNGVNLSYNDKDYPYLYSETTDVVRIKYRSHDDTRTLLLLPVSEIRYIKFKYTEK